MNSLVLIGISWYEKKAYQHESNPQSGFISIFLQFRLSSPATSWSSLNWKPLSMNDEWQYHNRFWERKLGIGSTRIGIPHFGLLKMPWRLLRLAWCYSQSNCTSLFVVRAWKQSIDFPNFFYKTSLEAKIIHIIKCLSTHYNFDSRVMISTVLKEIGF